MATSKKKIRRPWEGQTKCPKFIERPENISKIGDYDATQKELMNRLPHIEELMWKTGKTIIDMRALRNRRGEFNLKQEDAWPLLKEIVDCTMNVIKLAFERCRNRRTNLKTLPILCSAALLYSLGNYAAHDFVDLDDSIRLLTRLNNHNFSRRELKTALWELVIHFPSCEYLEL